MTTYQIEPATGNFLRPNGHGGYLIRQSDLSSWWRCNLQKYYEERAARDPEAPQPRHLSATEYGSVVHYAVMVMELAMNEGDPNALDLGLHAFTHYWDPRHIHELPGVVWPDEWMPRETHAGLKDRGLLAIRTHYDLLCTDNSGLLALEYQFAVPLTVGGRQHTLTGTVDRLSIRMHYGKPYLSLDDNKTGRQPTYLRFNSQGSGYAWASTLPEFWTGYPDSGMHQLETFDPTDIARLEALFGSHQYMLHRQSEGVKLASRRFRWFNLKEAKLTDGGWRTEQDYAKFHLAVDAYVKACEAEAYSVNTTGEICRYCPFRESCGGVGHPDELDGAPNRRVNIP